MKRMKQFVALITAALTANLFGACYAFPEYRSVDGEHVVASVSLPEAEGYVLRFDRFNLDYTAPERVSIAVRYVETSNHEVSIDWADGFQRENAELTANGNEITLRGEENVYYRTDALTLNLPVPVREVIVSGAVTIDLDGACIDAGKNTAIRLSGAAGLNVGGFDADQLTVTCSGACSLDLEANARSIRCETSGSCDVDLRGTAEMVRFKSSGACSLNAADFVSEEVSFSASGACDAEITVLRNLTAVTSGTCSLIYYAPSELSTTIETSGVSAVKRGDYPRSE